MNSASKSAITAIGTDAWAQIKYTNAIYDENTQSWVSVAEIPFTAFSSRKKAGRITGRLVVRRIRRAETESHCRSANTL